MYECKFVPLRAVKAYGGSGDRTPLVINLGTSAKEPKCIGTYVCGNSFVTSVKKERNFPVGTFCALVIETRGYHDLVLSGRAD
jgi:hypothetical protein